MAKIVLVAVLLTLTSCMHNNFFGARVVGPYIDYYDGQLVCAYVKGWHKNRKCLCIITDMNFSNNRTLMPPENQDMCKRSK